MAQQLCQSLSTQQAQQGLAQAQPRFGCIWDAWYNGITPELSPMSGPLWRPKYLRKGRAAPRAQSGVAPPSTGGQKTSGVKARGLAQTKHNRRGEPDSVGAFYFRAAGGRVVDFSFPRSTRLTMTAQPSSSGRRRTVVWAPAVPGDPRDTAFPWGGCRPTSLLQSGVDSTPERQRERATFWLTSQEKQSTEGAGQGRRSVPLKERKREGEGVTFKKREGRWQLGPGGLSHGAPAQRGRGGTVTFSLDGGEEGGGTQRSHRRAQRCPHVCPFGSQQHEWICSSRGKKRKKGNHMHGLEGCVGVFMRHKKDERGFHSVPLSPAPTHGTRLKPLDLKAIQNCDRSAWLTQVQSRNNVPFVTEPLLITVAHPALTSPGLTWWGAAQQSCAPPHGRSQEGAPWLHRECNDS